MSQATLPVVLLLVGVLVWSGVGKLRSERPDAGFDALQVPAPLASRPIRRGLPWVELVVAVLLVVASGGIAQVAAALVALLLFLAYLWLIARTLAARARVSCNCFGSSAVIVNRWTLIRNILLVLAAAVVLVRALAGASSPLAELTGLGGSGWADLVAAVAVAGVVGVVVRAERPPTRSITVRPSAAPAEPATDDLDYVRRPTPWVALEAADGSFRLLRDLTAASAQLVLFMSPTCESCHAIEPLVPGWAERLAPVGLVVAVKDRASAGGMAAHLAAHVWIDHEWATLKAIGGYGTPSAVLLGADGLLAGGPVGGDEDVRGFVEDVLAQLEESTTSSSAPVAEPHMH